MSFHIPDYTPLSNNSILRCRSYAKRVNLDIPDFEIPDQPATVGTKSPILNRYSLVAPQP